jgi:predicted  nucleic acid-binding Zn-ribbon protein
MRTETETKDMKKTEEYRNDVTIHLVKICGELGHIREKVDANHTHLEKINGRLRDTENSITAIKTIGSTLTIVIGVILTWLGIQK